MANNKLIICDVLLIVAGAYGFISGNVTGKKFAMGALVLYMTSASLSLANEMTNDSSVQKANRHAYLVANVAGIDLLVTDICIASQVDGKVALLNLIPPTIDLLMRYVIDSTWDPITPYTHIVSIGLLMFFSIRDEKYILIGSAACFLFSIFGGKNQDVAFVNGFNSAGVFFTSWFLGGKDIQDFGIDI